MRNIMIVTLLALASFGVGCGAPEDIDSTEQAICQGCGPQDPDPPVLDPNQPIGTPGPSIPGQCHNGGCACSGGNVEWNCRNIENCMNDPYCWENPRKVNAEQATNWYKQNCLCI